MPSEITVEVDRYTLTIEDSSVTIGMTKEECIVDLGGTIVIAGAIDPGTISHIFVQASPASFWSFANPLNRIASVTLYSVSGEEVHADVTCTSTTVTATFAQPFAGSLVLN